MKSNVKWPEKLVCHVTLDKSDFNAFLSFLRRISLTKETWNINIFLAECRNSSEFSLVESMLCRFCSDRDSRVRRAAVDGLFLLCQKAAPLTLTSYSTAVTVRITSPILHILIFRFLVLYYPFYFSKDRFFIYEMWSYSWFLSFQKNYILSRKTFEFL